MAFLLLLYERMIPALYSFRVAEGLGVSVFQEARERFWRSLTEGAPPVSWGQLRDNILDSTPDSEDFGSLEASFALNAALIAAYIASLLEDGQDSHVVDSMQSPLNAIGAYLGEHMGTEAYTKSNNRYVNFHPLLLKEMQTEEQDIAFLSTMPDTPWSEDVIAMLLDKAAIQGSLFDDTRKGSLPDG